uniref:Solute carrier family 6 member 17 n=1 Tax=Eptatretus burgeri TaxID=7764 RepID=A0A8C4NJS6_EPTBU
MRRGSVGVWTYISSKLGGIGYTSCLVCYYVAMYYNVIICWSFFYFFNSFQSPLPWATCPVFQNATVTVVEPECQKSSATTFFWYRETLDISNSISEGGDLNWRVTLCLLLAWLVVGLAMIRGIQSSGKVMYFSSIFPYGVLFCFLVRGLLLEGAFDGIKHMFMPKLEVMAEPQVWRDAATQVFFALGLGFGGVIAFSSYNKRDNNCHFDALLVSFINFLTSVLATLVVFAVLGFKANIINNQCIATNTDQIQKLLESGEVSADLIPRHINLTSVSASDYQQMYDILRSVHEETFGALGLHPCVLEDELNKAVQGTGLAFIAFTEAITHFPASPFWSIMFFLMLINLGLGSMFGTMEGIVTSVTDTFKIRKEFVTMGSCLIAFMLGLLFVQRSGNYFVTMFDDYSATLPLIIIVILENIAVSWVYGTQKFMDDLKDMIGYYPPTIYKYMWTYISPIVMIAMLLASIVQMSLTPPSYSAWIKETASEVKLPYPPWALGLLTFLIILAILPVPFVFLLRVFQFRKPPAASLAKVSFRRGKILQELSPMEERDDTSLIHGHGYRPTRPPPIKSDPTATASPGGTLSPDVDTPAGAPYGLGFNLGEILDD